MSDDAICHRCGALLTRANAELYIVTIDAVADPDIAIDATRSEADLRDEYDRLIDRMRDMTETELNEQVHRRLTIILCNACYKTWIENPTG
jgi:hypothetical protein